MQVIVDAVTEVMFLDLSPYFDFHHLTPSAGNSGALHLGKHNAWIFWRIGTDRMTHRFQWKFDLETRCVYMYSLC